MIRAARNWIWEFPKLRVPFWGPHNKDCSILGSILGSPYFGKLPYSEAVGETGASAGKTLYGHGEAHDLKMVRIGQVRKVPYVENFRLLFNLTLGPNTRKPTTPPNSEAPKRSEERDSDNERKRRSGPRAYQLLQCWAENV